MKALLKQFKTVFEAANAKLFDLLFIFFLALGALYGFKRGVLRVFVETFEFIIVLWLVYGNFGSLAGFIRAQVPVFPEIYADVTAYFLLLIVIWAAVLVVDTALKATIGSWIQAEAAPFLHGIGGALAGIFYFMLIYSVVFKGITLWPTLKHNRFYLNTASGGFLVELPREITEQISLFLGGVARSRNR